MLIVIVININVDRRTGGLETLKRQGRVIGGS